MLRLTDESILEDKMNTFVRSIKEGGRIEDKQGLSMKHS